MGAIAIAGNMGVGKSTLCRYIAKTTGRRYVSESEISNPFLNIAYENRKDFNLRLQLQFLFQRFSDNTKYGADFAIFDRTFYDGPEVFARVHAEMGNLEENDLKLLKFGYQVLLPKIIVPSLLVFLYVSPQICFERLQARNDAYSPNLRFEFVEKLSRAYEAFYSSYSFGPKIYIDVSSYDLRNPKSAEALFSIFAK